MAFRSIIRDRMSLWLNLSRELLRKATGHCTRTSTAWTITANPTLWIATTSRQSIRRSAVTSPASSRSVVVSSSLTPLSLSLIGWSTRYNDPKHSCYTWYSARAGVYDSKRATNWKYSFFLAELSCGLHICLYVNIIWKTKKPVRASHCISVTPCTLPMVAEYNYGNQVVHTLSYR